MTTSTASDISATRVPNRRAPTQDQVLTWAAKVVAVDKVAAMRLHVVHVVQVLHSGMHP